MLFLSKPRNRLCSNKKPCSFREAVDTALIWLAVPLYSLSISLSKGWQCSRISSRRSPEKDAPYRTYGMGTGQEGPVDQYPGGWLL